MGDVVVLDAFRDAKEKHNPQDKKPDVASAIVVTPDDKIVVIERKCKDTGEIFYDVPGGKQEKCDTVYREIGPSLLCTLRRELRQELGIEIGENVDHLGDLPSPSPKPTAVGTMRYYYGVFDYKGEPRNMFEPGEGHLALLELEPEKALERLLPAGRKRRISEEAENFIRNLPAYRAAHEQHKRDQMDLDRDWGIRTHEPC